MTRRNPYVAASWLLASLVLLLAGCVDRYLPPVISAPQTYLVVDGFINLRGVTTVRLSRSRSLNTPTSPVETNASVTIQDETGVSYPLFERIIGTGTYTSDYLTLSPTHQYQLRLRTGAGREYASDLVTGKLTPAIDQLSWASETNGVQVYLDAHDPAGATGYYRWTYQETWAFHSDYQSGYEYVNNQIQARSEDIYHCWRSENSTAIKLSTTTGLSQDVVAKFPLTLLPANSDKLGTRYSILVQQYAQTPEEYAYWDNLRKNTESLGTLFDPLPSQLSGNVHGLTDASELVLGYVGTASVTERRLFIDRSELPAANHFLTGYENCLPLDTVLLRNVPFYFAFQGSLPVYAIYGNGGVLLGYTGGAADCVDCRLRGTNVRPSFW